MHLGLTFSLFFPFFVFFTSVCALPLCGSVDTFSSSQCKCNLEINRACLMNSAAFRATSQRATGLGGVARRARFLHVRLRHVHLYVHLGFGGKIKGNAKKKEIDSFCKITKEARWSVMGGGQWETGAVKLPRDSGRAGDIPTWRALLLALYKRCQAGSANPPRDATSYSCMFYIL